MAIPERIINEIRERADIVEIIDSYLPLKRTGRNYKALCPFHPEKTPSFFVSPEKQIFHCFGCGEGGNVFHFLMKYLNLSFTEAVKQVASMVGVEIPEVEYDPESKRVLELNKLVMEFYIQELKKEKAQKCRSYLSKRGLDQDTIELFKLGYADEGWDSLTRYLRQKGYSYEFLLKAGLILQAREGDAYFDLFRDRLIFPIIDHKDKVLGFGGRTLSDAMPKYLNSPETPVYKKGRTLYGINVTLPEIKKEGMAIVVEGYMDMISMYQAGIKNVVASLGTALTPDQVRFLRKYVDEIVIVYDGDQAGQIASLRGLDVIFEVGAKAKALSLPEAYDPDSFLKEKGKDAFLKLLEKRQEIFDYKLEVLLRVYGRDSLDSRIKIIDEMFSSLSRVSDYLVKAEYMKKLAEEVGFEERILWDQYNARMKRGMRPQAVIEGIMKERKYEPVEGTLIYMMLTRAELIPQLRDVLAVEEFLTPQLRNIVKKIYEFYPDEEKLKLGNLCNHLSEDEVRILTQIMSEELQLPEDLFDKVLEDCIIRLKELRIKSYCDFLTQEIKKAQQSSDNKRVQELLKELNEIMKGRQVQGI